MKTRVLTLIGLCVCLLVSCTSEQAAITTFLPKSGETVKITAYADGAPQTKTGLVDKVGGGKSVVWKSGNAISLFFNSGSNGGNKFTTTTNGPIAEFVGSITAVSGDLSGVGGSAHFWGLYPYKSSASCDGHAITTTLPANQKAYQGDVADNLLVTVGRSIDLSIHFKNACSVIGFTVSQEDIKKIVFSGNAQEPVAGEFNISFDENDNLVDAPTSNAVDQIIITPAETTTFEPGVTYYFAILPNQFSAGYSMTFTKSDYSEATFIREDNCTFEISTFYKLTNKDEGLTFTPSPISDENIVFADDKVKTKLVAAFDTDEDGELSYAEAAAVTSIEGVFGAIKTYKSFDEFQYFTGVTTIPGSMFADWNLLTSIVLPESIQEIWDGAFMRCVKLSSIVIPESVTFIANYAFAGCNSLTSIAIPEGVTSIVDGVFSDCSNLASIVIPESVTWIGSRAFYGCSSLTAIDIPESVTSIGDWAFSGCSSLASIVIPEGVPSIGRYAFYGCSGLTSVAIPERVQAIGESAFEGCSNLISIEIPGSVSYIGEGAFGDCSRLTSIVIPESVSGISRSLFADCSSLASVVIPESVTSIGGFAFYGCSSLTSVVIPESVTGIGDYAFYGCGSLASIEISESITGIGSYAFAECSSLTSIVIPEGVTTIENYLFSRCSNLTYIAIPESVTYIGNNAFRECSSLASVEIPESVTSIGDWAFAECSSLTSIVIPKSVTSIGTEAFLCSGLRAVTVLSTNPAQHLYGAFEGTNCIIYVPDESVDAYRTADGWSNYESRIFGISESQKTLDEIAGEIINNYLSGDTYTYIDNSHDPVGFSGPSVLYKYLGPRDAAEIGSSHTVFNLTDALPDFFNVEEYLPEINTIPMTIAPTQADSVNLFKAIKLFFTRVAAANEAVVPYLKFEVSYDGGLIYVIEALRADKLEFEGLKMRRTNTYFQYKGILKASTYDNKGIPSLNDMPEPAYYYDAFSNVIDLFLHFIGQGTLNETLYGPEDENYSINNL